MVNEGKTNIGLSVTRWGRLRELVQALLVMPPTPTLASLQSINFVQPYLLLLQNNKFLAITWVFSLFQVFLALKFILFKRLYDDWSSNFQNSNNSPAGNCPAWSPEAHFDKFNFWSQHWVSSHCTGLHQSKPLLCLYLIAAKTVLSIHWNFVYEKCSVYTQLVPKVGLWRRHKISPNSEWKSPDPLHYVAIIPLV